MCQINVVVEKEGSQEKIMESVTGLEVLSDGVRLTTFFEEPEVISGVTIKNIDFLGGTVVLTSKLRPERTQ